MLGADCLVTQNASLGLGIDDDRAGVVGEALEHPMSVPESPGTLPFFVTCDRARRTSAPRRFRHSLLRIRAVD